ncbi:MAG: type II toxin-antitoxin system HicA family toxin [Deltaproteobacteria bacterium]|nr:type II toxin-antitoxin system HicA family toxin [Deltaproteobacteria bacterium]
MINPLTSREIVQKLRVLGFSGPYPGGNHQYMVKGNLKVRVPNPHHGQTISVGLVKKIIGQAGLTEEEWEKA